MNFLLLLTLTFCTFINGDEENEKYIDLLPDADKQAFLDQVAKRLIKEVPYRNVQNNASREITNAELEEQNDFVKKVLEDESVNLRRQKSKEDEEKTEHVKDKNVKKNIHEKPYLDLTLRNGEWLHKSHINSEHEMIIPVKAVYDSSDDINNPMNSNTQSTTVKDSSEMSDDNDIQARGIRRNRKKHMKNVTQSKILRSESKEQVTKSEHGQKIMIVKAKTSIMPQNDQLNSDTDLILTDSDIITDNDDTSSEEINDYTEATESSSFSDITTKKTVATLGVTVNRSRITRNTPDTNKNNLRQQQNQTIEKHEQILTNSYNESVKLLNKTNANTENISYSIDSGTNRDYYSPKSTTLYNTKTISQKTSTESTTNTALTKKPELENSTKPASKLTHTVNGNNSFSIFSNINNERISNISDPTDTIFPKNSLSFRQEVQILHELTTVKTKTDKDDNLNDLFLTNSAATTILPYFNNITSDELHVTSKAIHNNKISVVKQEAVFDKLVKVLRQGLDFELESDDHINSNNFKDYQQSKRPLKYREYAVYEISAERSAFQEQNGEIHNTPSDEQPYYAPVYNYEPQNAYFNTYNRLGPNDVSKESISERTEFDNEEESSDVSSKIKETSEKSYLRKFKFKKKSPIDNVNPVLKMNNLANRLSVVKSPKFSDVYLNPNDYLDLDYYFGRMGKPQNAKYNKSRKNKDNDLNLFIPDSDDDEHPINTIKNFKAKRYLSDIRQLLFKHKIFGHIAERTTEKTKTYKNRSRFRNKVAVSEKKLRYSPISEKNISLDYYYSSNGERISKLLRQNRSKGLNKVTRQTFYPKHVAGLKKFKKEDKIKDNGANTGTLMELLKIGDPADFLKHLDTMLSLNIPLGRNRDNEKELEPFLRVLRDMIQINNEALVKFDWLGTAVEINAAIEKLSTVTETLRKKKRIHTADLKLLKYVQYLYLTSKQAFEKNEFVREKSSNQKKTRLPKNKRKKRDNFLKTKGLINRVWLYLRGRIEAIKRDEINMLRELDEMQRFLNDLSDQLFNLHNTIKHIAKSARYKEQLWYKNLKDGYLKNATKSRLLPVLLHIKSTRLFDLIEEKARNGLENFNTYEEDNQNDVKETLEEFVFVLKVLDEIKRVKQ